jgi:hypothetical protein
MMRILSPSEYPMVKPAGKLHNKYRPVGYAHIVYISSNGIRYMYITNLYISKDR